jgi:hypothetical protein
VFGVQEEASIRIVRSIGLDFLHETFNRPIEKSAVDLSL